MGEREERSYTDATAGLPVPKVTAEREVESHLCSTEGMHAAYKDTHSLCHCLRVGTSLTVTHLRYGTLMYWELICSMEHASGHRPVLTRTPGYPLMRPQACGQLWS